MLAIDKGGATRWLTHIKRPFCQTHQHIQCGNDLYGRKPCGVDLIEFFIHRLCKVLDALIFIFNQFSVLRYQLFYSRVPVTCHFLLWGGVIIEEPI